MLTVPSLLGWLQCVIIHLVKSLMHFRIIPFTTIALVLWWSPSHRADSTGTCLCSDSDCMECLMRKCELCYTTTTKKKTKPQIKPKDWESWYQLTWLCNLTSVCLYWIFHLIQDILPVMYVFVSVYAPICMYIHICAHTFIYILCSFPHLAQLSLSHTFFFFNFWTLFSQSVTAQLGLKRWSDNHWVETASSMKT